MYKRQAREPADEASGVSGRGCLEDHCLVSEKGAAGCAAPVSYTHLYTSAMQGLTLVITGAVFALYCFTSGFWEKILNLPKSMILLMFLEALLSPALSYWSGRQRFEYRYRILVCVTILQALMNPIASLVLIRMNGGTAMMRILGIVGVQVCICVPIIVFQFCKGKEFFSKEYWGYACLLYTSRCV